MIKVWGWLSSGSGFISRHSGDNFLELVSLMLEERELGGMEDFNCLGGLSELLSFGILDTGDRLVFELLGLDISLKLSFDSSWSVCCELSSQLPATEYLEADPRVGTEHPWSLRWGGDCRVVTGSWEHVTGTGSCDLQRDEDLRRGGGLLAVGISLLLLK